MELKEYKNNAIPITLDWPHKFFHIVPRINHGCHKKQPTYRINATKRLSVVNVDTSISDRLFFWTTAADRPHAQRYQDS